MRRSLVVLEEARTRLPLEVAEHRQRTDRTTLLRSQVGDHVLALEEPSPKKSFRFLVADLEQQRAVVAEPCAKR